VIESEWQQVAINESAGEQPWLILPLERWRLLSAQTRRRTDLAVWLDSHEAVESIVDDLQTLPLVGLNFPVFTDGRPFSSAWLLRTRYGFQGEIRALGDVRYDLLEQMYRTGFNTFSISDEQVLEKAASTSLYFSDYYQATG